MAKDESFLERILDGTEDPTDLPIELLDRITDKFSDGRIIGRGGFGVVYKGVFGERVVAVKKIDVNIVNIADDEKQFFREFSSLWKTRHENIVRFLGYCSNKREKWIGGHFYDMRERLFCFEYIRNGSLDKHITVIEDKDDDMLRIEPLDLEFNKDMSWSVKLTNKTKSWYTFNIEGKVQQYTIGPYKGIMAPECNECITVQAQKSDLQFTQTDDKIIVRSTAVRNGFTVEDIDESTFRKEDHKVVDEVDIMVVPKRNIGETSSGKGTLGSNENVEAASMCKYYPPKSFSRSYPTDTTYLGEASRAVDVVTGPMGSLLHKLGKLVTEDYSLADSIKSDIQSFSEDLRILHRVLLRIPMVGNNDKDWVEAVRQLAYKIEDMVDSFLVHREPDFSRRGFKEIMHGTVKLVQNGRTTHRQIGDVIKDIKADVKAVADRQQKYKIDVKDLVANATAKATIDLRVLAIYEHKDRLVGIKTPRDEIIRLLKEDDDASNKDPKIISIVGMGGLGKTTLAKAVYDDLTDYHHKAFVSVGQNPDVKTVLKKVLHKCQENFKTDYFMIENLDVDDLIEKLQHILGHKRYFIVIDDIWDSTAWGIIKSAFPKNNRGSIIITTTRVLSVAQTCCNNARKYVYSIKALGKKESRILFLRRTFGLENDCLVTPSKKEISNYILKTCGGMPLAINTIASLLAGKPDSVWENVRKSLGALTEGRIKRDNPMYNLKQILDLSYMYLTDDLKTCLLYACNYPEDTEIDKYDLLRQWVAEGFVRGEGRLDAEGVAENKFQALINMFMIEPGKMDCKNEVLSCTVHDLVLDLIRSKSSQVNFIEVIDGLKDEIEADRDIRQVSVHSNVNIDSSILATIKGSLEHVRSVLLYRGSLVPYFLVFRYVRVLHLVENGYSEDIVDLTGISRLLLLRYLKIKCSWRDLKLPGQIGELQQLETIDLEGRLQNYPSDIVTLPLLSHLRYNAYDEGVALPDGINRLKSLRILEGVCVYSSSVDNINGLGELTNLRKLGIKLTRVELRKEVASPCMNALHSSIRKLSTNLRILYLRTDCPGFHVIYVGDWWHGSIVRQVSSICDLDLGFCRFDRCPVWVGQLQNLYSLSIQVGEVAHVGVSIAAGLPSLVYFHLYTDEIPSKEETAVISGGGAFQSLKHLIFGCPKTKLTFEEGAMPRLEKLQILFRYHMARRFLPDGIGLLQADTLKEIILLMAADDMGQYKHMDKDIYWFKLYDDEHERRFRTMLKRAFKSHYPATQIYIQSRTSVVDDREVDEGVDDEEHCCSEKDYEVVDDEEDE